MKYEGLKVIEERVRVSVETILKPLFEIIENPLVTDLHVNADGTIYAKGIDGDRSKVTGYFENRDIETVAALLASGTNNDASASSPVIPAAWDNPALRFQIFLPPVVDAPAISIRKHGMLDVSLDELEEGGVVDSRQHLLLSALVREKKNIIISGGMGSGKTTLANSLIREIPSNERLFVIQDTKELNLSPCPDNIQIVVDSTKFTARDAVFSSMRSDADRIIVGEVRDGAALELLKAWNTGHRGGIGTIHANSPEAVPLRFKTLIMEVSTSPLPELVEEALDAIVQVSMTPKGRRVTHIKVMHKEGIDGGLL